MSTTILATVGSETDQLKRLLYSLAQKPLAGEFEVVVFDRVGHAINDLKLFPASFKWTHLVPHVGKDGQNLSEFVTGQTVMNIPAMAVPVGNAVQILADSLNDKTHVFATCLNAGNFIVEGLDDYGSNLDEFLLSDCSPCDIFTGICTHKRWHTLGLNRPEKPCGATFVHILAEGAEAWSYWPIPEDKVLLSQRNYK